MEQAVDRVAQWLDGTTPQDSGAPTDIWACVEIFGHRKHYGRVREVEKFGAKLLRIDVPIAVSAPLLGEEERFETHLYGGSSIFSFTPMTEEAARKWAASERRYSGDYPTMARLPAPRYDGDPDYDDDLSEE